MTGILAQSAISPVPDSPALLETLHPRRTALMIVDVQVDFGSSQGLYGRAGLDLSRVDAAVDRMIELHEAAHRAGVFTVFVRLETGPQTDSLAAGERRKRNGTASGSRPCAAGTAGASYYRVAPRPGDAEVIKHRYSSFTNTSMDFILKSRPGLDTLVICGLTTECCVDTAVRDAFVRDYHVFLPLDACASYREDMHKVCGDIFAQYFAIMSPAAAIVAAWSSAARNSREDH
jgi:nicotinamidase-related amidase